MNHYFKRIHVLLATLLLFSISCSSNKINSEKLDKAIVSIETGFTISKVRTAQNKGKTYIVASSYEGTVIGVSYDGKELWRNELSGFMNHDLWAGDISGDGVDEILAANADGSIYCLNNKGKLLWKFKQNEAPMYAVCVINKDDKAYVVCGGYDNSYYYVSPKGKLISEIASKTYSVEKPYSKAKKVLPPKGLHLTNFLRPAKLNGKEILVVHGVQNSMNGNGTLYYFNPLEKLPYKTIKVKERGPYGDLKVGVVDEKGNSEVLMGRVGAQAKGMHFTKISIENPEKQSIIDLRKAKDKASLSCNPVLLILVSPTL